MNKLIEDVTAQWTRSENSQQLERYDRLVRCTPPKICTRVLAPLIKEKEAQLSVKERKKRKRDGRTHDSKHPRPGIDCPSKSRIPQKRAFEHKVNQCIKRLINYQYR